MTNNIQNTNGNYKTYLYAGKLINFIAITAWFIFIFDVIITGGRYGSYYLSDFLDEYGFDILVRAAILGAVKHWGTVLKRKANDIEIKNASYQMIPKSDGTIVQTYNILNNVVIQHKGSTIAYEAIAVGKTGVFVLNTCNKSGVITGKVDDATWVSHHATLRSMSNEMFPNPLNEIKYRQQFLRDYLMTFGIKIPVKGIVLMSNAQSVACSSEKLVKTREEAIRLIVRVGGYDYEKSQITKIFNVLNACKSTEEMPPEFNMPLTDKEQLIHMEKMLSDKQKADLGIDFERLKSLDDEDDANEKLFEDALDQMMDAMNQQQIDEFNRWSMEESVKAVTPFEMGGYEMNQGNSWNIDQGMNNDFNTGFNDLNNSFDSFNNGFDSFNNGFDTFNSGFNDFGAGGGFNDFGMF